MPTSSKPRHKYKPKPVRLNAFEYAIESVKPLANQHNYVVDWTLKVHEAFEAMMKAQANQKHVDTIMAASNICEALVATMNGRDPDNALGRAGVALWEICDRANAGKGTAMKAAEMQALRDLMASHDELLKCVTVKQFETALDYAKREVCEGRARKLKAIK